MERTVGSMCNNKDINLVKSKEKLDQAAHFTQKFAIIIVFYLKPTKHIKMSLLAMLMKVFLSSVQF